MAQKELETHSYLSNEDQLHILKAALQTPTGDNCQPFRFAWRQDVLEVYHDQDRARHYLNINNVGSHISLGCLLESVKIACSDRGFSCKWEVDLPLKEGLGLAAKCWFEKDGVAMDRLSGQIHRRYTDRRVYRGSSLPEEFFDVLRGEAETIGSCGIRVVRPNHKDLIESISALDQIIWTTRQAQQDLQHWLRLRADELPARDGMPWQSLGIGHFEKNVLLSCRKWWVQRLLNALGGLRISRSVLKRQLCSSGYLCLITTTADSPADIVACGRLILRTWLELNGADHGVQPVSLASFLALESRLDRLTGMFPPQHIALIETMTQALSEAFQLGEGDLPVWLIRTGEVERPSAQQKTPRFAPNQVMMT